MIIFSSGLIITDIEQTCLLHVMSNPEEWLLDAIINKAKARRDALIKEWEPRLFADPSVTELPANEHEVCDLIMARNDYRSRAVADAELDPPQYSDNQNIATYEAVDRSGMTVTLFPNGMDVTDVDVNCILAYVHDLGDWVLGALLGKINQGKKQMIKEWNPIIMADPSVTTMPATEDGLINMIVARDDYKSMSR